MDIERIRAKIADIAAQPKHVRFEDLVALLDNHISKICRYNHHGNPHHAFTVNDETFNVSKPHGGGFVKRVYVMKFLEAMEALGLYEAGSD